MQERSPKPQRLYTKKKPGADSRTKFDGWLEEERDFSRPVIITFGINPINHAEHGAVVAVVKSVDRYMILIEFDELTVWVAKSNILSARDAAKG